MLSSPDLKKRKFIDLFCGIGGMRLAYEAAGCECAFSSDWDKYAQITYQRNFREIPKGDIHTISASDIPDHDILVGGFPCQPFSISGVSTKNSLNRPHRLRDQRPRFRDILQQQPPEKYTLTKHLWNYLQDYAKKHQAAGNGFGYGLVDLDGISRTLSARYYKDGSEILIPRGRNQVPRRLTPRESPRLMRFPEWFEIAVSSTQPS